MNIKIQHLILWPKDHEKKERILSFDLKKINILTGDSQKGKSSIIPIIDYCLGSSKCTIPVGLIREKTEWFGVILRIENTEMLIARKEPGQNNQSTAVFIKEGIFDIEKLPRPSAENDVEYLKNKLNEIVQLPYLTLTNEQDADSSKKRASFRDFSAFQFQPQHIVANPYTLFYKADTANNQERLRNIFPLVIGAIDKKTLLLRQELKEIELEYAKKEREYNEIKKMNENWFYQLKSYYLRAREYGLIPESQDYINEWSTEKYLYALKMVFDNSNYRKIVLQEEATSNAINELQEITNEEIIIARDIGNQRLKLSKLRKLFESEKQYHDSIGVQRNRLEPVGWFLNTVTPNETCILCGSQNSSAYDELQKLSDYAKVLSEVSNDANNSFDMLDREIVRVRNKLKELEENLNRIRRLKDALENQSESLRNARQTENEIFRFIGRLENSLENYKLIHEDDSLLQELIELDARIRKLRIEVDTKGIDAKIKSIINLISKSISFYADKLGVEDSEIPVQLDIKNLTVKRNTGKREDYLWEIGSGANWMGFHVSTMLALHDHFTSLLWNPVSQFLVFDQPSQVYFPDKLGKERDYKSEDIIRVQKIFSALQTHIKLRQYATQIIVIEHADEDAWGLPKEEIHIVARWRNNTSDALIPKEWL
ncbi:DUF3732 domain-containing protein [Cohnella mopanensis]|uniref:DUF3732 domain-containing protein n=1 Tax=Cohnella mopanensis TaxID=2911966 RepID=UPI001EF91DCE|nr:DUF3732 domain-containing protein [Cohnella mopanensis]